jgi:hypothetical protein
MRLECGLGLYCVVHTCYEELFPFRSVPVRISTEWSGFLQIYTGKSFDCQVPLRKDLQA